MRACTWSPHGHINAARDGQLQERAVVSPPLSDTGHDPEAVATSRRYGVLFLQLSQGIHHNVAMRTLACASLRLCGAFDGENEFFAALDSSPCAPLCPKTILFNADRRYVSRRDALPSSCERSQLDGRASRRETYRRSALNRIVFGQSGAHGLESSAAKNSFSPSNAPHSRSDAHASVRIATLWWIPCDSCRKRTP